VQQRADIRFGLLMIAPAMLTIFAVAFWPLFNTFRLSLFRINLRFANIPRDFIGFDNYRAILEEPRFFNALKVTGTVALVSLTAELLLGMLIALAINRSFQGRGIVRAAVLVPWALTTVVAARMWGLIYQADYGVFNRILYDLYIIDSYKPWVISPTFTIWAMIGADIWKTTPFVALLLLAGLQLIPNDLYEAAEIDGATKWQSFWQITLPLLRPTILVAMLFRLIDVARMFDLPFVLTNGGPGFATETLTFFTYRVLFQDLQFGRGSAVAVIVFLLVALISFIFIAVLGAPAGRDAQMAARDDASGWRIWFMRALYVGVIAAYLVFRLLALQDTLGAGGALLVFAVAVAALLAAYVLVQRLVAATGNESLPGILAAAGGALLLVCGLGLAFGLPGLILALALLVAGVAVWLVLGALRWLAGGPLRGAFGSTGHAIAELRRRNAVAGWVFRNGWFYVFMAGFVLFCMAPFLWTLITSLKSPDTIYRRPTDYFPDPIDFTHWRQVLTLERFTRSVLNSAIVASASSIISLTVGALCAYAVARVRFPGKNIVLAIVLAVSMFPGITIVSPLYLQFSEWGLTNTKWALILPNVTFTLPICIWTLNAFFRDLPFELEEAARVDGATRMQTLLRVVAPLAAPGVFTTFILLFIAAWNEFLFARVFISRESQLTATVAIAQFEGADIAAGTPWGQITAASVIITLPLVILVLVFQRRIVAGLTAGAVKG
jgi:multiple sugar transport system permease protein